MTNVIDYKDRDIMINNNIATGEYICEWINKDKSLNKSYMEAKLSEIVGNNNAGAWPIRLANEGCEKPKGMRCFVIEFIEERVIARWI